MTLGDCVRVIAPQKLQVYSAEVFPGGEIRSSTRIFGDHDKGKK